MVCWEDTYFHGTQMYDGKSMMSPGKTDQGPVS